uniref:ZP domain-containing protein n=1 Tax=Macrostomum lignano TaxID=282301 RepID=A0A1I8II63_9PLAT
VMYTDNPYQVCIMDQNLMNAYYANNFCKPRPTLLMTISIRVSTDSCSQERLLHCRAFNGADFSAPKRPASPTSSGLKHFPVSNPECHVPEIVMTTRAINLGRNRWDLLPHDDWPVHNGHVRAGC